MTTTTETLNKIDKNLGTFFCMVKLVDCPPQSLETLDPTIASFFKKANTKDPSKILIRPQDTLEG